MRKYPPEHWQRLGQWVHDARTQAGFTDMDRWSAAVGRTSRVLYGLERGEGVGAKTIEAIADALGVTRWWLFWVLAEGDTPSGAALTPADIERMRQRYESETGRPADRPEAISFVYLVDATDDQLLHEIRRRLAGEPAPGWAWGDGPEATDQAQRAGEGSGQQPAPMKQAGPGPANVHPIAAAVSDLDGSLADAADDEPWEEEDEEREGGA